MINHTTQKSYAEDRWNDRGTDMQTLVNTLVVLALFGLLAYIVYRVIQNMFKRAMKEERSLDDRDIFMRNSPAIPATVLRKKQVINPDANGIAKVDLELQIHVPEGSPAQVSTT